MGNEANYEGHGCLPVGAPHSERRTSLNSPKVTPAFTDEISRGMRLAFPRAVERHLQVAL
ncbi:MAG: hypothetical protein CM1200mP14_21100 [Gammaproteobacteria bacterium]|nr:MAG: hypothetical protein CM1200mP14_21100 [Gammaproteobacteria bacterium]